MVDRLAALARRVEENPDFLALTLADYARSEGFDRLRRSALEQAPSVPPAAVRP
jgi:hypothetical protein